MNNYYLFTDGGCHGNPGPGAWAWRLVDQEQGVLAEGSGYEEETTNNRMELTAVIEGLRRLKERFVDPANAEAAKTVVVTDSQYVRHGITDWIHRWRKNGWITTAKKPVKNGDLWRRLDDLNASVGPTWEWVRGHTGDVHNEACDALVQETIKNRKGVSRVL